MEEDVRVQTTLDQMVTSHTSQFLKAAIPYLPAASRQVLSVRYCGNVVVEFIEDCNNEIVAACRDEYYLKRSSRIDAFIDALKDFKSGN